MRTPTLWAAVAVAFMATAGLEGRQRPDVSGFRITVYKKTTPEELAASMQVTPAKAGIADVAWIAGAWTGAAGPVSLEERWSPPAGGAMLGVSRTIRDSRMVAFEFLRIVERNGTLLYIAQPNGRPPTEFTLTAFDAGSATFENPAHDFPKKIRYAKRADGGLDATISGDPPSKPQTFTFKAEAR